MKHEGCYSQLWVGARDFLLGLPLANTPTPVLIRGYAGPGWSVGATETLRTLLPLAFRAEVMPDREEILRVAAGFPISRWVLTRSLPPRIHSPALAHNWAVAN